jgi:hypothetical protein
LDTCDEHIHYWTLLFEDNACPANDGNTANIIFDIAVEDAVTKEECAK